MYNQVYIDDFPESKYIEYLKDLKKLEKIRRNFLLQYTDDSKQIVRINEIRERIFKGVKDPKELHDLNKEFCSIRDAYCCDAQGLVFKESLDHYVLKKILEDKKYIDSEEFNNYWNYIQHFILDRKLSANGKDFYLEMNTNVVFRNSAVRAMIFKKFFNDKQIANNERLIARNANIISRITEKMKNRERVSQIELDLVGDYIYSSRDFSDDTAKIFVEYIFNEIENNPSIRSSVPIMGAVLSYYPQCFTKGDYVKNSRMYVGDFDSGQFNVSAHSSGSGKYCVFSKDLILRAPLLSKGPKKKARSFNNMDLYSWMMVAFHELTHEYQKKKAVEPNSSSSGISSIIKAVLNDALSARDKNGRIIVSEYGVNHDSTESEMEDDEEAWRQCESFIAEHCRRYAYRYNRKSNIEWEFICKKNVEEIQVRRMFSLKKNPDGKLEPYAVYDVRHMIEIVKQNPSILKTYPMLKTYFNDNGFLRRDCIFENMTDSDNFGLDAEYSGLEFAAYIINNGSNTILKEISSGKLSEEQIDYLMSNVYNVLHQNVLRVRGFEKVDLTNFDETMHRYNLKNGRDSLINYYFRECAKQIYIALEFMYQIKKSYPNIDSTVYFDKFQRYYAGYFYELFGKIKNINVSVLATICDKYDASNTPELMELSEFIKSCIRKQKNNNNNDDDVSQGKRI